MKFYSAATRGFYDEELHGTSMPADVLSISEEQWLGLLEAQSKGMQIQPDDDGRPIAVHPETP